MSFVPPEREQRRLTDIEGSDYLTHPLPHSERVKHLESWLREALVLPFSYTGAVDREGNFVSFGQRMVEINERAVAVRAGQVGEARVSAERDGVVQVEAMLNKADPGDVLFLFSPPGSEEEGFGLQETRRLSFTYIFVVSKGEGDDRKSVRTIAIPRLEIPPLAQLEQFIEVFKDIQVTTTASMPEVLTDRFLVATPFLVSGLAQEERATKLDEYTKVFAGQSWQEIEVSIEHGLKLQKDLLAEPRRRSLINSISWQIRRYVEEQNPERLNNIGEATRIVLAREASGHYVDMMPEALLQEYSKTEASMWLQRCYQLGNEQYRQSLLADHGGELVAAGTHLLEISRALAEDPQVSAILNGSQCGGGGYGAVLDGVSGKFGQAMGRGHLLERQMEALKETTSSGAEDMKCVTCPFCSKTVDAIVTVDYIQCPACDKKVSKG